MAFDFPLGPTLNQLHTPMVGGPTYAWNGTTWLQQIDPPKSTNAIIISDTPPAPVAGTIWWESDTGILHTWYNDGSSGQWIQISGVDLPPAGAVIPYMSLIKRTLFTASGTYTKSDGLQYLEVELMGAGGGGGGAQNGPALTASCGGGGGAGAHGQKFFNAADIPATVSYTVGAAGLGVARATGQTGGTTTFLTASAGGGAGGGASAQASSATQAAAWTYGGAGGNATGCDIATSGAPGGDSLMWDAAFGQPTYAQFYYGGAGGGTLYGRRGREAMAPGSPSAGGSGSGSGGTGALGSVSAGTAGSAGAAGFILITEYF